MKHLAVMCAATLLTACAMQPASREPVSVDTGEKALADVRQWYEDTAASCPGHPVRAAVSCSGVLLRATENNPAFLPWDPSPSSIARGGVSFSYLRADVNFTQLVFTYRNGYIMYPRDLRPEGTLDVAALCAFPMDADTANRPAEQGCGENAVDPRPEATRACDAQDIGDVIQWNVLFAAMDNKYSGQCGWNIRDGEQDAAARFLLSLRAHEAMPEKQRALANELRLATWPRDSGTRLPIRAFFYVPAATDALAKAQDDQRRYRDHYGVFIPVLQLVLPITVGESARFDYRPADQIKSR